MQAFFDILQASAGIIAAVGLVLALLALLVVWRAAGRASRAIDASAPRQQLVADPALDHVLTAQMQRLDGLDRDLQELTSRTASVEAAARLAVQSAGLVRFNPFREDTGGNLSFALALLDADDNGIVLSSLHSRQTTRVYLKAITAGQSDQALSEEETEALRQARGGGPGSA